jgi:GntR family transcriptional regulator/MocR family aminotransferase
VSRATSTASDRTTLLDLLLDLDPTLGRQAGLEAAIRAGIRAGQLVEGTRLPSTRALALELGFSRATVVGAFDQLVAEGYLRAVRGSGTAVAATPPPMVEPTKHAAHSRFAADFRPGEPDRSSFPRSAWLRSVRTAIATSPDELFGYDDASGLPALRRELATYLGRSRAVAAHPDRIFVFPGFNSALSALCAMLCANGASTIAVEDPCLPFHRSIARQAGLRAQSVAVDAHGVRVDDIDADAVLVTPAHQYPTGVTLTADRRASLIEWARRGGGWIIEDDYDGELRYDRQSVGSLQGLAPERVVYAGTSSKMLAPGVALAWLVVPDDLVEPLLEIRRWRVAVSTIEQAALADFIASGALDRHLRRMRGVYRARRDDLVRALERFDLQLTGIAAGLHVTARLPDDAPPERELVDRGLAESLAFHPLEAHRVTPSSDRGLVIGYGRPPDHAFPSALHRLSAFLARNLRTH